MIEEQASGFIRRLCGFLEEHQDRLVVDADTHATDVASLTGKRREHYLSNPNYYHGRPVSAEDLIREMDMAEVDAVLSWQNPSCTPYTDDRDGNAEALLAANRYIRDSAERYLGRFIPGGWTDPKACGVANAIRIAETCVREYGFVFVKMNPAQNRYPIDSAEVVEVFDRIVELGAIPAFHFGGDSPFTPAEGLERIALRHPDHPVLAIHMGGGGSSYEAGENLYQQARALGLRRPNIRYAESAKRDTHIESDFITYQMAGPPFSNNIFCASDAPYGRICWNFGGYRGMFQSLMCGAGHTDERVRANPGLFTEKAARDYMGGNFVRFVLSGYAHLLKTQGAEAGVCR